MKKLIWPETEDPQYHHCALCKKLVGTEIAGDGDGNVWYTPESRYWNPAKRMVYCGVTCSWEDYCATNKR